MSTPATTPTSWVEGAAGSGFDVDHLPYGVVARPGERPRVAVRIGDQVLDLSVVAAADMVDTHALFDQPTLNAFMAAGPAVWDSTRAWVRGLLTDETERDLVEPALAPLDSVTMLLPFTVGDYVDFYASEHHASNVGHMFRPDAEPLLPNWKHLPVGYHGRSGTVVVSGTDVVRPCGQRKAPDADLPTYGPSQRLDIEAELGFVVGVPSTMGERVTTADFARHTFGVVGLNDWSARDIQAWEYVPLGPFLGKSFATSISAWVTPLAALAAAWTDLPGQDDPAVLDYLRVDRPAGLDIEVEVVLDGEVVARPPYRTMYWSPAQMLAHTTVNGASVRTGDLWGSGTVSGPERDQRGSLLELSWGGKEPFTAAGRERTFLEDGDEVTLRYSAPGTGGGRISLGEVTGRILPAR
ncbi:fumarylacetoacetase [Nocardioides eburneiflavus]|uniref:fumarylacetoacetase n=1 Tax=Nocardioides eburneiflavus TaxID=2518372 RepID=A0A4Z1CIN6_9ACTN|nr:fumarylacetoacetase [Nocardioides eburneiflavus]TGN62630.1 fumarylacetoacetase [Nocardioides eburneiflavus]